MRLQKTKLNNFLGTIRNFNSLSDTSKALVLCFYFTETLHKTYITTADLRGLYYDAKMALPSNFGGEIRTLLKSKKIHKSKYGYSLNISAKELVRSYIKSTPISTMTKNKSLSYVNPSRMRELGKINSRNFDLSKLLELCKELNNALQMMSFLSIALLVRAILDHIPPVFGFRNFSEVANNHGTKSFKDSMLHLDDSSRKIADAFLHTQIRSKEVLPNFTQVDFSNDLDVLLSEIYRILK